MSRLTAYEYLNKKVRRTNARFMDKAQAAIKGAQTLLFQKGYHIASYYLEVPEYGWAIRLLDRARRARNWLDIPCVDYICIDYEVTTPRFVDYYQYDSTINAMQILSKRFKEEEVTGGKAGTHTQRQLGYYSTKQIAEYIESQEFEDEMYHMQFDIPKEEDILADQFYFLKNVPI